MKNIIFKVKALEDNGELFVEGYSTIYGVPDRTPYKDCLMYGCFKKSLNEKTLNEDVIVSLMHDRKNAVGQIIEIDDRPQGLWVKIKISDAEENLKIKIKEGIYNKLSLGFLEDVTKSKEVYDENNVLIRNEIKEAKLIEFSVVKRSGVVDARFGITEKMIDLIETEDQYTEIEFTEKIKSLIHEPLHSEEPQHSEVKPIDYKYIIENLKI